jgi:FAD/FMN-containing dehydrogenase
VARNISRQSFLRGALGVVAVGAVFGPGRAMAVPGTQDWDGLAASIGGRVILPSNGSQYATAKRIFNSCYDASTPAAVVTVASTADVQHAVAFAAKNNIKISVRSGGHSYIGASAANATMVIDLRQLPVGVSYDDASGLATVPPAADVTAVQSALAAHGKAIPTGSCLTVGIAGLALGGGLGVDSRAYGLTSDMLASVSVVLPSGEAITAAPGDHDDLYWALRGGGGGNFGVTTSLTFRTFPAADRDVVNLAFAGAASAQAIVGWHHWSTGADRSMWATVDLTSDPNAGLQCGVLLVAPAGAGPQAAADLIKAIGVQPISNQNRTLARVDLIQYLGGDSAANQPHGFVAGSDVIAALNADAATAIVAAISAWPRASGPAHALIDPLDGAVAEIDAGATAFPWRRQPATVQWFVSTPTQAVVSAATQWVAAAHQAVRGHSAGGYVNYIEQNTPAARYFAGNLPRLSSARQTYDPGGLMFSGLDL